MATPSGWWSYPLKIWSSCSLAPQAFFLHLFRYALADCLLSLWLFSLSFLLLWCSTVLLIMSLWDFFFCRTSCFLSKLNFWITSFTNQSQLSLEIKYLHISVCKKMLENMTGAHSRGLKTQWQINNSKFIRISNLTILKPISWFIYFLSLIHF